jgi:hypothetical protein
MLVVGLATPLLGSQVNLFEGDALQEQNDAQGIHRALWMP